MAWAYILIGAIGAIALFTIFGLEIRANNKRIERGEPPKKHHDITDWDILPTIDLTQRSRPVHNQTRRKRR